MDSQKASILVVDDVPDNLRLLSDLLTQQNFQVRKALNGSMALQSVAQSAPDLILLDIQMPDMDGFEVCSRLKADESSRGIPIIFISVMSETLDKVKAFALGAVDYIPKPFDIAEVMARVNNQLQIRGLQRTVEKRNDELRQAIADLELALLESSRLRTKLQQSNQELMVANQKLAELATIDGLTKIPNRRRFDQYLAESWQHCLRTQEPLALILGDIDFFKKYNDCYGHQMGDQCLFDVAQAVKKSILRTTDLAARYGGEELAVILPNTNLDNAKMVAQRMLEQVRQLAIPHEASLIKTTVSLSLGVHAVIPSRELTLQILLEHCDQALYHAKENGRDRLSFYQDITTIS